MRDAMGGQYYATDTTGARGVSEFGRQLLRGSPWQSLSIMRLLDIDGSVDWMVRDRIDD